MKKKFIILIGVVVIIFVLTVFLGGAFVYDFYNSQSWEATGTEANGWKSYKNGQYSFQYQSKFPSDYFVWAKDTPDVIVTAKGDSKIDSNGCYTGSIGSLQYMDSLPEKFKNVKINGLNFCFTKDGDLSGGVNYEGFYYTVYRAGDYFTMKYIIGETVCRNNPDDPESVACMDSKKNRDEIIISPINDSVATFKFSRSAFVMNLMKIFSNIKHKIRNL